MGFPDPPITIVRLRTQEGVGGMPVGIVGCVERKWSMRKEEECSMSAVSGDQKHPTLDRLYCGHMFNGWAIKRAPNATKIDRRPADNITTPHANFHHIPRTFSGHL